MSIKAVVISFLWLLSQGAVCGQSTNWFTLSQPKSGFSIRFPAKPEDISMDRKTPAGTIHHSIWALDRGDRVFNLMFMDIPHLTASDGEGLIDSNIVSQIAVHLEGKLVGEKDAPIAGHPGKEFTLAMDGGKVIYRGRVFMIGVRQFTLSVYGDANRSTNDDFTFLNSIQLVTNAAPSKGPDKDGR